jgi:hypothetical protein
VNLQNARCNDKNKKIVPKMFGIVEVPTRYGATTTRVTINIEEIFVKMNLM